MRNVSLALLAFIILAGLLMAGCSSTTTREAGRFYSDDFDYSIRFPDGWHIEVEGEGHLASALSPLENNNDMFFEAVSVSVDDLNYRMSTDEWFNEVIGSIHNDFVSFREVDRGEHLIGNTTAKWIVFTYSMAQGEVKAITYCMVRGNRGYAITCDAQPHKFLTYRMQFDEAAFSFKFS